VRTQKIGLKRACRMALGDSDWVNSNQEKASAIITFLRELGQAGLDDRINMWGCEHSTNMESAVGAYQNLQSIPWHFWARHVIDELSFLENGCGETRHFVWNSLSDAPKRGNFVNLMFDEAQMKKFCRSYNKIPKKLPEIPKWIKSRVDSTELNNQATSYFLEI
jgi:hypothetical protein